MGRKYGVILCESNKARQLSEHITLFSIPKNPTIYDQWTSIVNAWNCNFNEVKYLCYKHFDVEDINKTFDGYTIQDNQISTYDLINIFESIKTPKTWTSYMDENVISFCCVTLTEKKIK